MSPNLFFSHLVTLQSPFGYTPDGNHLNNKGERQVHTRLGAYYMPDTMEHIIGKDVAETKSWEM